MSTPAKWEAFPRGDGWAVNEVGPHGSYIRVIVDGLTEEARCFVETEPYGFVGEDIGSEIREVENVTETYATYVGRDGGVAVRFGARA